MLHWLEHDVCGDNSHLVTLAFGIFFPIVHSGLASLRPFAEKVVGARFWRVVFASCSLPLAYSWIVYFIGHAHDGFEFWNGEPIGWVHGVAWTINFLSFFFLYPSVFNLKEGCRKSRRSTSGRRGSSASRGTRRWWDRSCGRRRSRWSGRRSLY